MGRLLIPGGGGGEWEHSAGSCEVFGSTLVLLCLRLQRPIVPDYVTVRRSTDGAASAGGFMLTTLRRSPATPA